MDISRVRPLDAWHVARWADRHIELAPDPNRPPHKVGHAAVSIQRALESGAVGWYHKDGFLIGNAQASPINHDLKIAQTLTFMSRARGPALLRRFEEWAKEQGCHCVCISVLTTLTDTRRLRVWKRLGYDCGDVTMIKTL